MITDDGPQFAIGIDYLGCGCKERWSVYRLRDDEPVFWELDAKCRPNRCLMCAPSYQAQHRSWCLQPGFEDPDELTYVSLAVLAERAQRAKTRHYVRDKKT
jgi:hypothetical protein